MLAAIEAYFLRALQLPSNTTVLTGPCTGPSGDGSPVIEVAARRLSMLADATNERPARNPAYRWSIQQFEGDGATRDFSLLQSATGQVEVSTSLGRAPRRGDDYLVENGWLHFQVPPEKAVVVTARVRGASVRGYVQAQACRIDVAFRTWAGARTCTDELSRVVVGEVLRAVAELETLDGFASSWPEVSLRLQRVTASLAGIERSVEQAEGRVFYCSTVELTLLGDLEQTVILGDAEPEGIIRAVRPADN